MVDGFGAGKGDKERPCNRKQFCDNWIKCFGVDCPDCGGCGKQHDGDKDFYDIPCKTCNGLGKVERKRRK